MESLYDRAANDPGAVRPALEDPDANCRMLEETLGDLGADQTDLIVLPEMFATGFTMNSREMAEPMDESATVAWLRDQAVRRGCVITGSVAVVEGEECFNRLLWHDRTVAWSITTSVTCSAWPASTNVMPWGTNG